MRRRGLGDAPTGDSRRRAPTKLEKLQHLGVLIKVEAGKVERRLTNFHLGASGARWTLTRKTTGVLSAVADLGSSNPDFRASGKCETLP